jgi:hypothetical protein
MLCRAAPEGTIDAAALEAAPPAEEAPDTRAPAADEAEARMPDAEAEAEAEAEAPGTVMSDSVLVGETTAPAAVAADDLFEDDQTNAK